MEHKKGPADHSRAPNHLAPFCTISLQDRRHLAQRIGTIRQHRALGTAALEAAAGRLIDRNHACPRPASLLADRLTQARDLAIWEGRA
jgi:hypothetical protein